MSDFEEALLHALKLIREELTLIRQTLESKK